MAPEGKSSLRGTSSDERASARDAKPTGIDRERGIDVGRQRKDEVIPDLPRSTGNRSVDNRMVTRTPPPEKQPLADLPRSIGNRYVDSPVMTGTPPPMKQSWTVLASPESESRAQAMDELERLTDQELIKRRGQVAVKAVEYFSNEQQAALRTLEDIEFVASRRRIEPMTPRWPRQGPSQHPQAVQRRLNVRAHLEEGVRLDRSFEKALKGFGPSSEIESDIEHFKAEARRFATEFRSRAVMTALRMLDGSQRGIEKILLSYGLPNEAAITAANRLARGSDLDKEVAYVIQVAVASDHVDAPVATKNRVSLANRARRLNELQQVVAQFERGGAGTGSRSDPDEAAAQLAAARKSLDEAWAAAARLHPVLSAFRLGDADVVNVNLTPLTAASIEGVMKAVVRELVPKLRDIGRARALLKKGPNALDPLSLPAVVALTRTNMFIPEGSLRDGVARDLAAEAARGADSVLVMIASFALAIITLVPSGGTSLGIPIGAAGIVLTAYSIAQEWEEYSKLRTLSNTDLDLARSLSTEDPSLASFVISLALAGFDVLPLVRAFHKARRVRGLVASGDDAGEALLRRELGKTPRTPRPKAPRKARGKVPEVDTTNTLGKAVAYKSAKAMRDALGEAFTKTIAKQKYGTEELNPMMINLLEGFRYKGKTLDLKGLGRVNLRHVVTKDGRPLSADTIRLLKQLPKVYKALRDPKFLQRVAGEVWQFAADYEVTTREALEAMLGGDIRRDVWIKGLTESELEQSFHQAIKVDSPFVDNIFANSDHGAYTHMFQELVVSRALGTKWGGEGGRRFRVLIAELKGQGPEIIETVNNKKPRDFWAAVWDALFDDLYGNHYLNQAETIGELLQTHLGLPKWIVKKP